MPTVHVTGHHNRQETREYLSRLKDDIVIGAYHGMNISDIKEVVGDKALFVPERGKAYDLEGVLNEFGR